MTKKELVACINLAFEAVDDSLAGPIWADKEKCIFNQLGVATFQHVLSCICPKSKQVMSSSVEMKSPKEPWQSDD